MALRKILVGVLSMVMVSPAWSGGLSLGNVTSSDDATVRGTKLTPGSTLFTGDEISVAPHGGAIIALAGGAQAEVLGNSSIRLTKAEDKIQLVVNHGQASFHTSGGSEMTALVGDVTVRPAARADTSAIIQSLSETHVIVAAQKGALLITMAKDGKVYTIPEGEAADLTAKEDPPQSGGAMPAGKAAPPVTLSTKALTWTVVIVGGAMFVTAYLLLRHETKLTTTQIGNEISPDTVN